MGMWRWRAGSAVGWDWGDVFGEWSSECVFFGVDRESRVVFSSMRRVSNCRGTLIQKWLPQQVQVCPGLSVGWQVAVGYAVQLFWRQVQRASQWGRKCCVETVSLGHVSVRSSRSCILLWLDHVAHLFGVMPDLFKVTWMLWTGCMFTVSGCWIRGSEHFFRVIGMCSLCGEKGLFGIGIAVGCSFGVRPLFAFIYS